MYMNQILFNKKTNRKLRYIFRVQLIISILVAIFLILLFLKNYNEDENLENISKIINKNIGISTMYESGKTSNQNIYFGKIYIDKINLEYAVFNTYNEELLKISPCKFSGGQLGTKGNICIAGHNYNDDRFFGKLANLEYGDKIKMVDLENNEFEYIVYDIFETNESDTSVLKANKNYELTLLTCNNANKKRIIVKAYFKEYT